MKITVASSLLFLLLFSSCGKMEAPEFKRIENFAVKKIGLKETTIGFGVVYFNPNGFAVNVKEAVADIYIDSVYIGKFTQEQNVSVGQKADFSIPLTGNVSIIKALQLNLTDLSNREISIKADGSVKVGKGGVFITRPITYQGKHKLDNIRF